MPDGADVETHLSDLLISAAAREKIHMVPDMCWSEVE